MSTQKHKDYANYIMQSVARVNPHRRSEGRISYLWASGFLASYLASLLEEDPRLFRQFQRHIEHIERSNK